MCIIMERGHWRENTEKKLNPRGLQDGDKESDQGLQREAITLAPSMPGANLGSTAEGH